MRRRIEALSKILIVTVVAGVLPLAVAGTASAARVKTIRITNASLVEGDVGSANMSFTVSWTGAKGGAAVQVNYATANVTATAGTDYTATSGTASMLQNGCHCATILVPVLGDLTNEGTETFQVNLSNPVNGVIGVAQGIGTIYDNEGPPSLVVSDANAAEGAGTVSFSVVLTHSSSSTITVNYATANGTAVAGSDYTAKPTTTLTFNPGQVSKPVTVLVTDDALNEDDETFKLNLSNVSSGASIADPQGVGTILDGDPEPDISIGDFSVPEGDTGTVIASFPVTLSAVSGREVDVDYATVAGTATAGSDYETTSGTLVFAAGEINKQISVTIDADVVFEGNETFTVSLSAPLNANIPAPGTGLGTIIDNDAGPKLSVSNATIVEGNSGPALLTFTVSMVPTSGSVVTVDYATTDGTAAGSDYAAATGTLTFNPTNVAKTVTVDVTGDAVDEPDETLTLTISNPVGGGSKIIDAQGVGTIVNDDVAPNISIGDVGVAEGDTGTVTASFPVTLSAPSGREVDVNYATVAGTATAGSDYETATGTLVFNAGDTIKQIDVTVDADVVAEGDETFTVGLSLPLNASILAAGTGLGTITDDDAGPKLAVDNNPTVVEGNGGTPATLNFTVSMVPASLSIVTVDYATAGGTATAGSDYTTTSGTLTFAAGEVTKTVTVDVAGDTTYEPGETFTVNLSNPVGALSKIIDAQGIGTITNDDKAPTALTMKLAKGRTTIQAKGVIELAVPGMPAVPGMKVKATLYKKKGAKYVRVTSRSVSVTGLGDRDSDLRADGAYLAKFTRPARGAYQLKVAYAGSTDLLPCLRSVKFKL